MVPTYQEAGNIEEFLHALRDAVPDAQIVVCDDGSPDGTGQLAEDVAASRGKIEVVHRSAKNGLGAAYRHGFRVALDGGAHVVVQMDVDFSHPPSMVADMIAAVEHGADVAVGSRYVPGGGTPDWPIHRRFLSNYGNRYSRWQLRLELTDLTSGFRAYRSETLEAINFESTRANGYGFQIETGYRLAQIRAKVVELPLVFHDRVHGDSKMSVKIMAENLAFVTWWGCCIRFPRLTDAFRRTRLGKVAYGLTDQAPEAVQSS